MLIAYKKQINVFILVCRGHNELSFKFKLIQI